VETRPTQAGSRCSACGARVRREARFCPECGGYRNPPEDRRERRTSVQKTYRQFSRVLIFYFAYLSTIVPLFFLEPDNMVTGMVVVSVIDAFLALFFIPVLRIDLRPLLKPGASTMKWTLIGFSALWPLLALNLGYHHLLVETFGIEAPGLDALGMSFGMALFVICIMPGIWEEVAFRGLVQGTLQRSLGVRGGIVLSAILFAIIHQNIISAPILLLMGLLLGWIRHRSGSLYPGMVVHFTHNLVIVLLM
jgi:CAAX protease family protein